MPVWLRTMRRHRFPVATDRLSRVLLPSAASPLNSLAAAIQTVVFGRRIDATALGDPPVVIVGFLRTGTTLMHELLASDPRHTAPTMFQCMAPQHFLVTQFLSPVAARLLPRRRPMDEMKFGVGRPFEDEFALCLLGLDSPYDFFFFPRSPHDEIGVYDDEIADAGPSVELWRTSFVRFLKAVCMAKPGRLVLKSPPHTARIAPLVQTFPEARFVHMTRDPLAVVPSAIHTVRLINAVWGLQRASDAAIEDWVFRHFEFVQRRWEAERTRLQPDRFIEVRYEEFVADPITGLERIYATLGLGPFAPARALVERYLAEAAGYRTNRFTLDAGLRRRILERCDWSTTPS